MQRAHTACIVHRATCCARHAARHKRRPVEYWSTHERPDLHLPCTHRLGCMRTSSLSKTLPRRKVSRNFQETFRKPAENLQCANFAFLQASLEHRWASALHRPLEDKLELAQIGRMRAKYPDLVIG